MKNNLWIFSNFKNDFLALWGIAFLIIPLLIVLPQGEFWGLLALIGYVFIDSGHVYLTGLRSFLQKESLYRKAPYIFMPLIIAFLIFAWCYSGTPYLWTFILYVTFYHNTKQHYGIVRWYEKLNTPLPYSGFFLYLFTIIPYISFHFRDFQYTPIYHKHEFFFYPHPTLFLIGLGINLLALVFFLLFTWKQRNKQVFPVFVSILLPGIINFCCFTLGQRLDQVLLPIVYVHGIAYFFLISTVVKTTNTKTRPAPLAAAMVLLMLFFSSLEFGVEELWFIPGPSESYKNQMEMAVIVSLLLTPLLTHYLFDGFIWKKSDPMFSKYFNHTTYKRNRKSCS